MPASYLAQSAETLGKDRVMMDSFSDFELGHQNWFFSKNLLLSGSTQRPHGFPSAQQNFIQWWNNCNSNQRMVLISLANRHQHMIKETSITARDFPIIQNALHKWSPHHYAVFYGKGGYTCNLFVGESLYMAHCAWENITKGGRKYYAASQYWNHNECPFDLIKPKDVKRGDIVSWKWNPHEAEYHVEIVTKINIHPSDTGFCSIGAGRANSEKTKNDNGKIKCDNISKGWFEDEYRKIDDKRIKFLRPR